MKCKSRVGFLQEYGGLWISWCYLGDFLVCKQRPKCHEEEGVAHGCLASGSVLEEGGQQPAKTVPMFACHPYSSFTQSLKSAGSL